MPVVLIGYVTSFKFQFHVGGDGSLTYIFYVKMMVILFVNLFWSFWFVFCFAHLCH